MGLENIDLAKVVPCQKCGTPTRMMGSVPIGGNGLDLHFAQTSTCDACLQAKCVAAAKPIHDAAAS
jgi:hypothetical protein